MKNALVVLFALVVGAISPVSPVAAGTYEEASAAFQAGDYDLAAEKFQQLIEESPEWSPGYVVLGQCYYLTGRPQQGDETIRKAAEIDPETDLFQAYFGVGQMLYDQKRYGEASLPLERALEYAEDTEKGTTVMKLAYSYLTAGEFEKARATIEELQQTVGADSVSSFYLALACQKLGDYPCALKSLREASRSGGEDAQAAQVREYLAKWSHHWALLPANKANREALLVEAVADTRAWFDADPGNPSAVRYYGETLLAAGDAARIVAEFRPLAQTGNCVAQTALAKAYNSLGKAADARTAATEAVSCDPSSAEAHVQLASADILLLRPEHTDVEQVRVDLERTREAVASLERALKLQADHAHAKSLLGDARNTLGDLTRAEKMFVDRQQAYIDAVEDAERQNIRSQCQAILWKLETESEKLTAEEEAFREEHDCRQYAETGDDD
jgi:tetratricopeptide (TPR) repeat protein